MSTTKEDRGAAFLALHQRAGGFIMPNAWDAGSAIVLAAEGFAAIGTTSAGIAFSLGKPDQAGDRSPFAVSRLEALDRLRQIVACVDIPVNADLESGYGSSPEDVAETVRLAIAAGAAGGNIEDVDRRSGALYDLQLAVERIAAAREAVEASRRPFVLNARTDAVLQAGHHPGLAHAIERANRYIEAGAQCIFTPGVTALDQARQLVRHVAAPLNLVVGLDEADTNAHALIDAGVARVSVGGSIARAALGLVRQAARELREQGTVTYARHQIPQPVLNRFFSAAPGDRRY